MPAGTVCHDRYHRRMVRIMHAIHISVLGIWLGAVLMAGTTAAIIFPQSKSLGVVLPDYQGYTGEHWRLAAGIIQAHVFTALDLLQLICCIAALLTLGYGLFHRATPGKTASFIRVITMWLLLLSLTVQIFFMHPPMDTAMQSYWLAARAGDNAQAAASLATFQKFHGPATGVMAFDAAALLIVLAVGAWAGVSPVERARP